MFDESWLIAEVEANEELSDEEVDCTVGLEGEVAWAGVRAQEDFESDDTDDREGRFLLERFTRGQQSTSA